MDPWVIDHFIGKLKIFYIYLSLPEVYPLKHMSSFTKVWKRRYQGELLWISGTSGDFVCKSGLKTAPPETSP
jgi:hypothetical protein